MLNMGAINKSAYRVVVTPPSQRAASGPEAYLACVSVAAHFDFTQAKRQVYTRVDPARDESGKFHRGRLT